MSIFETFLCETFKSLNITDDRNDDFDAVNRNHAFDNDFDLDMHEPGD